jgi:copper(I)-binding protein
MRYFGALVLLAAFSAQAAPATVAVTGAWARATLPHQDEGVAYFTLLSPGGDTLTEIDTPAAAMAMLHRTSSTGGMASMDDLENLPLPAGKSVTLSPGGTHVMLMQMPHPLKAGDTLVLSLHFAKAGVQTVRVPVLKVNASGPAH